MVYSPSQLDAAGDVDPVAEADVYLAYGRDLQAEEILKEAMRSAPTRVAIHNKLLEIYAKRRDSKAFEVVAAEAFGLTQGQGPEWEHACELGKELDPTNPLYQPGGSPIGKTDSIGTGGPAGGANTVPFSSSTLGQGTASGLSNDVDLDLDFSIDEPSAPVPLQTPAQDELRVSRLDDLEQTDELTSAPPASAGPVSRSMDFDLDFPSEPVPLNSDLPVASAQPSGAGSSTFDTLETPSSIGMDDATLLNPAGDGAAAATPAAASPELLSFDLNDIELELNTPEGEPSDATSGISAENPLETKLSLAEEFRAIGDLEGARSLAEEVLSEASGTLKAKAGTFLADLA